MLNIFEYPFVGLAVAFLSLVFFWLYGIFKPNGKKWWHYAVPFAIAIISFAICIFVQTDKEKIVSQFNKGTSAFKLQQIEPIKDVIADDYTDAAHSSKQLIVAYCEGLFNIAAVEKLTTLSRVIEIKDSNAEFTIEALVKFTEQSRIAQMGKPFMFVKARLSFSKHGKNWLISSSEILELDRKPVNWEQLH